MNGRAYFIPGFNRGFSLLEILLSLFILSSSIVVLIQGVNSTDSLERQARFEVDATVYAEREMEILKRDLILGWRRNGPQNSSGRFRLPMNWKSFLTWSKPDSEQVIRLYCRIQNGRDKMTLESFVYCPNRPISRKKT